MQIYLIRHGQTDLNKDHRLQGRQGLPLNAEGIRQAEGLKEALRGIEFDEIISSPQQRAVQTAEIASGKKAVMDERINVFDLGTADGLPIKEVKTVKGGLVPDPKIYSGVEKVSDYLKRITEFMGELMAKYCAKPDAKVLICGHKCTTGAISALIEGMPEDKNFLRLSCENGKVKVLDAQKLALESGEVKGFDM